MASRSLNRVILIGNLTRDPELKYTPSGTAVCSFGVATNRSWKTADGETKEETQYHRIIAWQKLAELCGKLLTKGRKVFLEGRLVYRTFTGRDSVQRTVSEIILDDFIVFGEGRRMAVEEESTQVESKQPVDLIKDQTENVDDMRAVEEEAKEEKADEKKKSKKESKESETKEKKSESEDVNPDDIPF